jgi:hypothetical protein
MVDHSSWFAPDLRVFEVQFSVPDARGGNAFRDLFSLCAVVELPFDQGADPRSHDGHGDQKRDEGQLETHAGFQGRHPWLRPIAPSGGSEEIPGSGVTSE